MNNVTNVSVNTNVNFTKKINDVETRFSYSFQGDTPPSSINVSANAQGQGGVTSTLNLYISPDGTNSPTGEFGCIPFDSAYYTALKVFVVQVFKNYKTPSAI
ncbi:MAG: hypothetical protein RRY36_08095 [Bacteroidaceae bacterium]